MSFDQGCQMAMWKSFEFVGIIASHHDQIDDAQERLIPKIATVPRYLIQRRLP